MSDTIKQIDEDFNGSKMVLQNDKRGIRYLFDEYQERRIQAALSALQKMASGDRVQIKTVGEGCGGYQVVYLDGIKQKSFSHVSDDYAHTNAREYAQTLRHRAKEQTAHIKMLMEKELNDGNRTTV